MDRVRKKLIGRGKSGFTLIELMVVVAIIGILAAIAIPLYASMQMKARVGRAQADMAVLANAFSAFGSHCGDVPQTILAWPAAGGGGAATTCALAVAGAGPAQLNVAVTDGNLIAAGPFMRTVPQPPTGGAPAWTYAYVRTGAGTFTVTATGDGVPAIILP